MSTTFPHGAARFLGELKRNNRKDWFDAHRDRYQLDLLEPAKEFVVALGARLQRLRPDLRVDPRINYGVKRMNRDTRFSKDKTLYKDHLTLWWWEGGDKDVSPGYWFDLRPRRVALAVGMYMIDSKTLARYRDAVLDDRRGKKLDQTVTKLERRGYRLEGPKTKRVPRGFDPDHPRARYLKHTGLYMWTETSVPRTGFLAHCLGHYRALTPVEEWLAAILPAA